MKTNKKLGKEKEKKFLCCLKERKIGTGILWMKVNICLDFGWNRFKTDLHLLTNHSTAGPNPDTLQQLSSR